MDKYIRLVMRRLFRLPHPMVPIDVHGATDAYCYYRNADVPYVRRLMRLSELGLFHTWDGIAARVHSLALCVEFPVLDAGFRFQTESAHDRTARKWERRVRVRDGLLVPYANAEFESLTRTARARVYIALFESCNKHVVARLSRVLFAKLLRLDGVLITFVEMTFGACPHT